MEHVLQIRKLSAGYGNKTVVTDISFDLAPGEILGIVGESGCGKTTILRSILRLKGNDCRVFSGEVDFRGVNMADQSDRERRKLYGTGIGMIFQNSAGTFNPLRSFRRQFADTLRSNGLYRAGESEREILEAFERLDLPDGKVLLDSRPFEMSGGMNQRVAIAMNMVLKPSVLLADEPTSALDVNSQQQVMEELLKLRSNCGTAIVLVTHNIALVREIADRIIVLYAGRIVEQGPCREVTDHPAHPYTRALLKAVPTLGGSIPVGVDGMPPLNGAELDGCSFAPRCSFCADGCDKKPPELSEVSSGHFASCSRGKEDAT